MKKQILLSLVTIFTISPLFSTQPIDQEILENAQYARIMNERWVNEAKSEKQNLKEGANVYWSLAMLSLASCVTLGIVASALNSITSTVNCIDADSLARPMIDSLHKLDNLCGAGMVLTFAGAIGFAMKSGYATGKMWDIRSKLSQNKQAIKEMKKGRMAQEEIA